MRDDIESIWKRLALIHVVVALSMLCVSIIFDSRALTSVLPVCMGQVALLAIWLALSTTPPQRRMLLYIGMGIPIAFIGFRITRGDSASVLFLSAYMLLVWAVIVSVPISVGRAKGWCLVLGASNDGPRWQLSIREIFALTLLVGLVLLLRRLVIAMGVPNEQGNVGFPDGPFSVLIAIAVFGGTTVGCISAILSALWSCLGNLSRLPATLIVIAILCLCPLHLQGEEAQVQWALMIATFMLTVMLSLLFLRSNSVRIQARPKLLYSDA